MILTLKSPFQSDFNEVPGSANTSTDNTTQSYTYDVTRNKLTKTYKLTLTLQKDPDGNWDITSYGGDLGPTTPMLENSIFSPFILRNHARTLNYLRLANNA